MKQEKDYMMNRQITLEIPERVLLTEKVDEASFARELRLLAAVNDVWMRAHVLLGGSAREGGRSPMIEENKRSYGLGHARRQQALDGVVLR